MSTASITPDETALRPAPGREVPLPEWVSTTDRNALPNVLNWASEAQRPPIGGRVDVISAGFYLGTATVTGYFHRDGELGCWVELDSPLSNGVRRTYYFGESLTRLDQGDEPGEVADQASVQDVTVLKDEAPAATAPAAAPSPAPAVTEVPDEASYLDEDEDDAIPLSEADREE